MAMAHGHADQVAIDSIKETVDLVPAIAGRENQWDIQFRCVVAIRIGDDGLATHARQRGDSNWPPLVRDRRQAGAPQGLGQAQRLHLERIERGDEVTNHQLTTLEYLKPYDSMKITDKSLDHLAG